MGEFPARFKTFTPEGYADLSFQIRVNPTNAEIVRLAAGYTADTRAEYGAALVKAYCGATVGGYGTVFDFSTAEDALKTLEDDALPDDLRHWLRSAPVDVALQERDAITSKYRAS